ncbi:MAG: hypothetical protein WD187_03570 [Candidatus Woykebacteria bacterium]
MLDRSLACKTCGTKVFKSPEEVDGHHKETHPDAPSVPGENHVEVGQNGENQEGQDVGDGQG